MPVNMFLKLDNIKGESIDNKHKDEIDVLAWSWGMQTAVSATTSGGAAGKVNVQDISITKHIDKATPGLMLACCGGQHFKEGLLTVRKAGETPLEYLKITMKEVVVSSISMGGSATEERLAETIKLNFAQFRTQYIPQKPDGSGDALVEMGWDIAHNVKI